MYLSASPIVMLQVKINEYRGYIKDNEEELDKAQKKVLSVYHGMLAEKERLADYEKALSVLKGGSSD